MAHRQLTICIVEDDQAVRDALVLVVQTGGHIATPFASAEAFLERDPTHVFDLLIVDLWLTGMNGIQLLNRLVDVRLEKPAILITGHADSRDVPQISHFRSVRMLKKPCRPTELLDLVSEMADDGHR